MTTKLAKDLEPGDVIVDRTVTSVPEEYEGKFGPEVRFDVSHPDQGPSTVAYHADAEVAVND